MSGKRTFWDKIAGLYDLIERFNETAGREMVKEVVRRLPPEATLLECAAGTGEISLAAAAHVRRVVCTDLSLPMLERACAKAKRLGLTSISFEQRDLFHLPEADGSYGAVCAANVLHLLEEPEKAVKELWRVTAPGGVLLLPTFLTEKPKPLMKCALWIYQMLGYRDSRQFSQGSYRKLFEDMGLPLKELLIIPGKMPVGIAVLYKPGQ